MPCLAIRRWNFHAKVANPKVNRQKVYHDDRSTLVGECYKLSREYQTGASKTQTSDLENADLENTDLETGKKTQTCRKYCKIKNNRPVGKILENTDLENTDLENTDFANKDLHEGKETQMCRKYCKIKNNSLRSRAIKYFYFSCYSRAQYI